MVRIRLNSPIHASSGPGKSPRRQAPSARSTRHTPTASSSTPVRSSDKDDTAPIDWDKKGFDLFGTDGERDNAPLEKSPGGGDGGSEGPRRAGRAEAVDDTGSANLIRTVTDLKKTIVDLIDTTILLNEQIMKGIEDVPHFVEVPEDRITIIELLLTYLIEGQIPSKQLLEDAIKKQKYNVNGCWLAWTPLPDTSGKPRPSKLERKITEGYLKILDKDLRRFKELMGNLKKYKGDKEKFPDTFKLDEKIAKWLYFNELFESSEGSMQVVSYDSGKEKVLATQREIQRILNVLVADNETEKRIAVHKKEYELFFERDKKEPYAELHDCAASYRELSTFL